MTGREDSEEAMKDLDEHSLAGAIDAWEHNPNVLHDAPYDLFRAAHRKEARYLWLLSRSLRPPTDVERAPIRNLLAWGLITPDASITPLGRRLLATAKQKLAPDAFGSMHTKREAREW